MVAVGKARNDARAPRVVSTSLTTHTRMNLKATSSHQIGFASEVPRLKTSLFLYHDAVLGILQSPSETLHPVVCDARIYHDQMRLIKCSQHLFDELRNLLVGVVDVCLRD